MGLACELAMADLPAHVDTLHHLRQCIEDGLVYRILGARVLGHPRDRAPHIAAVALPGIDANALLAALPGVAASAGSACGAHDPSPNHVLRAMGMSEDEAATVVRFSVGGYTTDAQIAYATSAIGAAAEAVAIPRSSSPCCEGGGCCGSAKC
jgi:cysteine desulfurase